MSTEGDPIVEETPKLNLPGGEDGWLHQLVLYAVK